MKAPKFTIYNSSCSKCNTCSNIQYLEVENQTELKLRKTCGSQFIIRNKQKTENVLLIVNISNRIKTLEIYPLELCKITVLNDSLLKENLS